MGVLGRNRRARRSAEDRPLGMGEASGSNPDESTFYPPIVSSQNGGFLDLFSVFPRFFERNFGYKIFRKILSFDFLYFSISFHHENLITDTKIIFNQFEDSFFT
jgi:hypothetical protein